MRDFRIGSVFGIPIKLDVTFLLVLPLFAYLIGSRVDLIAGSLSVLGGGVPVETAALTTGATPWVLGLAAAVGLFAGVVLHELGHSAVAMRHGFPIESITLWIFGGVARLTDMPGDWRQELRIAVAGPVVSVAVGLVCLVAFRVIPGGGGAPSGVRFVVGYLALMNLVLAGFNMLPGFPMDGGRVLRALLARNRPYARATKIASEVGKAFAVLLGLLGLIGFNIILIGLAFFIYIGAASEAQQTVMKAAFEDVSVRDIMTPSPNVRTIGPDASVAALLDRMLQERHTGYPVEEDGDVVGVVTLSDAREVDEVERDAFTVRDVMSTDLLTIDADQNAMAAIQEMQRHGVGRLVVLDGGAMAGLVSRSDVMTAFNIIQSRGTFDTRAVTGGSDPDTSIDGTAVGRDGLP